MMTLANRCLTALLSAFLVMGTAGCAQQGSTWGQKIDDTSITTRVKTALIADPDVSGTAINVETLEGQVMLSGFVDSASQASRAVEIASRVDGVNRVLDKMSVKAPEQPAQKQ